MLLSNLYYCLVFFTFISNSVLSDNADVFFPNKKINYVYDLDIPRIIEIKIIGKDYIKFLRQLS